MKFIFPQNYDFNSKLLGIIDYSTAIINVILWVLVYFILNLFIPDLTIKIIIFIIICFPVFLLSIIGFNHENIFYVFFYLFKYFFHTKVYLFDK